MDTKSDLELLHRFIDVGDELAFAALVRRHAGWVCAMAKRIVGNTALAEDVTQAVFILLARKAKSLRRETMLPAWLFTVTRYAANGARRAESRRQKHEREAAAMRSETTDSSSRTYEAHLSMLDELVAKLRCTDRQAVLLRFYQQQSFAQIGHTLGISEEAARKRISRAIEQLRERFAAKGAALGAGPMTELLGSQIGGNASTALVFASTGAALSAAKGGAAVAAGCSVGSIVNATAGKMLWSSLQPLIAVAAMLLISSAIGVAVAQQLAARPPLAIVPTTAPRTMPSTAPIAVVPVKNGPNGRILALDGSPIAGAKVTLFNSGPAIPPPWLGVPPMRPKPIIIDETVSDAQGQYAFKVKGDHFFVEASGYALMLGNIPQKQAVLTVDMRLPAGTEVRLRLLDPAGQPASGVMVNVYAQDISRMLRGTPLLDAARNNYNRQSDERGICIFPALPQNETLSFEVNDARFAKPLTREKLTLPRAPITEMEMRLQKSASISGRVYYEPDKKPAFGVVVRAVARQVVAFSALTTIYAANTDSEGKFTITSLPPGEFDIMTTGKNVAVGYATNWRPGILIIPGINLEDADIALSPGAIVRGQVVAKESGQPLAGAGVAAYFSPGTPQPQVTAAYSKSGPDGRFELRVAPGEREINASMVGLVNATTRISVEEGTVAATNIELVAAPNTANRPPAVPGITVRGTVVDTDGKPVIQAMILPEHSMQYRPTESPAAMRTNSAGHFEIHNVDPRGGLRARTAGGKSTLAAVPVVAAPDEMTIVVHDNVKASIFVHVQDEQGQPISNALTKVQYRLGGPLVNFSVERTTGPDGTWLHTDLDPDYPTSVFASAAGYGRSSTEVVIQPGKQIEAIVRLKKADGFISGMLIDEAGNPRPGVTLEASPNTSENQRTQTDESGHFRIEHLVKGDSVMLNIVAIGRGIATAQRFRVGQENITFVDRPAAPAPTSGRNR